MDKIDAVILCGGLGKRLRSVVGESQKTLAQVGDRPFLDVLIEDLKAQGLKRVILCTGFKAKDVEDYYRRHTHGLTIEFSSEEEPLGTGGALKNAQHFVRSNPFLAFNGDSYCKVDLKSLLKAHQLQKSLATLVISKVKNAKDYGTIVLAQDRRIVEFREKDSAVKEAYVNAGVYCLEQTIFSLMPQTKKFSIEIDVFSKLVTKNLCGFVVDEQFFDIGTPERYSQAKKTLGKG